MRGGAVELALISGATGAGKTELVSELTRSLAQHGGYLARARFEPQQQAIPYGPLLRACRELLRLLLTEPPHALQVWRQRFLAAVGSNGQLLIELLPELEIIIGRQPAVSALPPSKARTSLACCSRTSCGSLPARSTRWCCSSTISTGPMRASVQLMRLLLYRSYGHHLLVIGSYRADSLSESPLLAQQLDALRSERVTTTVLALAPLAVADVAGFLADTLSMPAAELFPSWQPRSWPRPTAILYRSVRKRP